MHMIDGQSPVTCLQSLSDQNSQGRQPLSVPIKGWPPSAVMGSPGKREENKELNIA